MAPKGVHFLIPEPGNMLPCKRDLAGVINLRLWRWELIQDHPDGPKGITSVLRSESERPEGQRQTRTCDEGRDVIASQEPKCGQPRELEETRKRFSPGASRGTAVLLTP